MNELEQEIARLRAENAALKGDAGQPLRFKISEKGGISVYGLGKWPVTLYRKQWQTLLGSAKELDAFMEANRARLDAFQAARDSAVTTTGSSRPRSTQDMDKALDDF